MNTSPEGRAHITREEGFRRCVYDDPVGLPTIGVGHLLTKAELSSGKLSIGGTVVRWEHGLSDEEVDGLLKQDLEDAERAVLGNCKVELSQTQFNVLVSFVFNVGANAFRSSTLLRLLNQGQHAAVPGQLRRWVFAKGQRLPGLVARREREAKWWETE